MRTKNITDMKVRLSTLWIVVMINMLFADVFSIMIELVKGNTIDIPGDVNLVMAVAAVLTNIPIVMIYLSRVLPYKANRLCNIAAAVFTIVYVIGGGDFAPHYIIIASVEVMALLLILLYSLNWRETSKE